MKRDSAGCLMLPSQDECLDLLDRAGCSDDVIQHVVTVARLARAMAERTAVDIAVVTAGALLHDVGRGFTHGPDHVPEGASFLEQQGVDERVVACVARHMGAGIEASEAEELGWPKGVWSPQRIEEKIVCHADNLTSGTSYRGIEEVLDDLEAKGLDHVVPRMRRLHAELAEVLSEDPGAIAAGLRA